MDKKDLNKIVRCPVCLGEFTMLELANNGGKSCPTCKTIAPALNIKEDGYFKANWQDLRVLTIYARRWAAMFDMSNQGNVDARRALENIVESLKKYQPKNAPPLVPENEVVVLKPIQGRPSGPIMEITLESDQQIKLKQNAEGKIVSPFYKLPKRP